MRLVLIFLFATLSHPIKAWEFGARLSTDQTSTDNVSMQKTNAESDTINGYRSYLQLKNEVHRFRINGELEKYKKKLENDRSTIKLGYLYRPSKYEEFGVTLFQENFKGTPSFVNDESFDNSGFKLISNVADVLTQEALGMMKSALIYKKYQGENNRADYRPELSIGAIYKVTEKIRIIPEINFSYNKSSLDQYSYVAFGPTLLLNITPMESVVLSAEYSLSKINYLERTFDEIRDGLTQTAKEKQTHSKIEWGMSWALFKRFDLSLKQIIRKNSSNNDGQTSQKVFTAKDTILGLGFIY